MGMTQLGTGRWPQEVATADESIWGAEEVKTRIVAKELRSCRRGRK